MIASLQKAYAAYMRKPFNFVWDSALYICLLLISLFASMSIFLLYFIIASALDITVGAESIPALAALGLVVLVFGFLASGLNASLAMSYRAALGREKTSLAKFYSYALSSAPVMFAIMLIRDFIWIFPAGLGIALYVFLLKDMPYMDILTGMYLAFVTFVIHMLFTPAMVSAGAFGTNLMSSLRRAYSFLRSRHIAFVGLYAIFAVVWLLNFVPFVNIATIFFLYPVAYGALISMMESGVKPKEAE